jgi:murein DD-endopeptidase MepM/ murein hydrolase activator NlpD
MTRRRGLLAFVCCLLALGAVAVQVPLVAGLGELGELFSDTTSPLERALTPPTHPELRIGPGGLPDLGLFELRREQRADPLIRRQAEALTVSPGMIKAFLAQSARGVLDDQGFYLARLPEGGEELADRGPARAQAAAELLGRYRRETGSLAGALLAWTTGPIRATRALQGSGPELEASLKAMRRRLAAPWRAEAESLMCTVQGLALTLDSRWPVRSQDASQRQGAGVQLEAQAGEELLAPMDGQATYVGPDGARGTCVELLHACRLRTELCGFARVAVQRGDRVRAGQALGTAGPRSQLTLWSGRKALDATLLLPPAL